MRLLLLIPFLVCAFNADAQTYLAHLQLNETGRGSVKVYQSADIDALVNGSSAISSPAKSAASPKKPSATETPSASQKQGSAAEEAGEETAGATTNKKVMRNGQKVDGYRIQVYAGGNSRTDKTQAENIGNQLKAQFPGQPIYVHFYSPRWICRMGNYRTYEEANAMLQDVRAAGFTQAILVKGKITVTNATD